MSTFNSYVVFDNDGDLLAHANSGTGTHTPEAYFGSLPLHIQRRAWVLLVLQERGHVAKYSIVNNAPALGARKDLDS